MKKTVVMTASIEVEIDESKFDEQFMQEFRESFYPFDSIDEHIEHLGQLAMRGGVDNGSFIEGYGPADEMGIKFSGEDFDDLHVEG